MVSSPPRILMLAPEPFFEPRGTPFSEYHRIKALVERKQHGTQFGILLLLLIHLCTLCFKHCTVGPSLLLRSSNYPFQIKVWCLGCIVYYRGFRTRRAGAELC